MRDLELRDLKANPKNPRKISPEKIALLKNALAEFGDLGCFVFNRKTKRLVGGHQRQKALPANAVIKITTKYGKPTKSGTTAEGYVFAKGERFKYREVDWDATREKAANIAANKSAGEWDLPELAGWMNDLQTNGLNLDLTMFDEFERSDLLAQSFDPDFEPGSEKDQGKLDEKKKAICPNCHLEFSVAGRI